MPSSICLPFAFYQATNRTDSIPSTRHYINIKSTYSNPNQPTSQPNPNKKGMTNWPTKQSSKFTASWRVFVAASWMPTTFVVVAPWRLPTPWLLMSVGPWRSVEDGNLSNWQRCRCGSETELVQDGSAIVSINCNYQLYLNIKLVTLRHQ